NKSRHLAALKEVSEHYRRMDLQTQTCDCLEFEQEHAQFESWDIRRLCTHLSRTIERHSLRKRDPDPIAQLILEEAFHGVAGVYLSQLTPEKRFAVVVRRDSTVVFVAAPNVRGDGFTKTN